MNIFTIEQDEMKDDIKITHPRQLRETLANALGVDDVEFIPLAMEMS